MVQKIIFNIFITRKPKDEARQNTSKKLLLFKILSALSPFIFLLVLELVLRLFNYGTDTSLFVKYPPDERFMVMN